MVTQKPLLVCIVGPTAIGKTALSINLAKHFQTEILSADSRQFYQEMTIGTAVPSKMELDSVPHHFIQHKSVLDDYSVGDFERDAINCLEQLFQEHPLVFLVGGSGLYVDAIVTGLDDFPEVLPNVREQLNEEFQQKGLESLQKELNEKDPDYFQQVDAQNPQRIIRALEVIRSSGKPFSSFRKNKKTTRHFDVIYLGLDADREVVYQRINDRVDAMMESGLLEEAQHLYVHRRRNALQTVGYRELFDYFDGNSTLPEAVSEIKKNTRRFAKRQGTWFRKNNQIHWFDWETPYEEIVNFIKETLTPKKG